MCMCMCVRVHVSVCVCACASVFVCGDLDFHLTSFCCISSMLGTDVVDQFLEKSVTHNWCSV